MELVLELELELEEEQQQQHVFLNLLLFQLIIQAVCGFCRISRTTIKANHFTISNASITRCCTTCKAVSPRRHQNGIESRRIYFTSTAPSKNLPASIFVRPPSSTVLTSCLAPSDAPQRSAEWFALRRDKLTTSTFSTALGFWKGTRRAELWHEKVFALQLKDFDDRQKSAMQWGVLNEEPAIQRYKTITGRDVSFLGFAVHTEEKLDWVGASPDGLLCGYPGPDGILEVKCPYNKGKPETALPWSTMPFYYMPQIQGQMEIMDREWVDLYCWTPNGSTIFRIWREQSYWELIHGILREFWWENVLPAREALLAGKKQDVELYKPLSTHKKTGLAIAKSIKLAKEAKLLCKEIAGHVEFYR
ncbi:hypothetical protein ACFE04_024799 [Oxalis oulophora]